MRVSTAICAALALGVGLWTAATASDLAEIRERGVLKVGVAELAPFVVRTEDGGLRGFEIDNVNRLAKDLGVEVEFVEVAFCELLPGLAQDRYDIVASGFSMTDDRRFVADYSLPYFETDYHVVVSKETLARMKTSNALNDPSVSLAYLIGGVSGYVAQTAFPDADLKGHATRAESFKAVTDGEIDGVVSSDPFYRYVVAEDPERFVLADEEPLYRTIEAFAVQRGEDALIDELNAWIIARDRDGFHDGLYEKWFNSEEWPVSAASARTCELDQS